MSQIKQANQRSFKFGAMESRDHSKNAAIPKSHTSRGNRIIWGINNINI